MADLEGKNEHESVKRYSRGVKIIYKERKGHPHRRNKKMSISLHLNIFISSLFAMSCDFSEPQLMVSKILCCAGEEKRVHSYSSHLICSLSPIKLLLK